MYLKVHDSEIITVRDFDGSPVKVFAKDFVVTKFKDDSVYPKLMY